MITYFDVFLGFPVRAIGGVGWSQLSKNAEEPIKGRGVLFDECLHNCPALALSCHPACHRSEYCAVCGRERSRGVHLLPLLCCGAVVKKEPKNALDKIGSFFEKEEKPPPPSLGTVIEKNSKVALLQPSL